jgi:hypothetical protein
MMPHKHHDLLRVCFLLLAIGGAVRAAAQEEQTQNQNPQGLDFYRISGNITTGVMISKQNPFGAGDAVAIGQDFSKANLYLALNLTRSWVMKERWQLDNLFDARLTAIPVQTAVTPTAANGNGNGNGTLRSDPNSFLLSSRKAAQMQLGIYVPIISPIEREAQVEKGPNDQPRKFANGETAYFKRAFYIAPIGKLGIQTLTEGQQSGEMARFGQDDVYNFWAIGGRIGVLRRFFRGTSSTSVQLDKDRGAESVLHLDFMRGRYENFTIPTTFIREGNDPPELRVGNRLWRYAFEGRLRLPYIPYTFVGFDANLGKGRDDVRFIFGINIELGPLVATLNQ